MISDLENRFEAAKEKFSREETSLIFTKFEAEKILEETELALALVSISNDENEFKRRLKALRNQLKDFLDLVDGLIELKRNYTV